MANKVSIFIHNLDGKVIELSNSKMSIQMACEYHGVNWNALFDRHVGPYDIIISDWEDKTSFDRGYTFVQSCFGYDEAKKVIQACKSKLKYKYDVMMQLRALKKCDMDASVIYEYEAKYNNFEVCELFLSDIIKR